ncbi:MAG: hypothetical protein HZB25_06875 [Candidatus Eisenbacteria bacterium]|nr:hypothetical protein [Candidatus Eisenbacteria bacterium]
MPLQFDIFLPGPGNYRLEIQAQDAGENLSPPSEAIEASYDLDWIAIRQPAFPIPSDRITALAVLGTMRYIGTEDAGLAMFERFVGWQYLNTANTPLADAHVTAVWPYTIGGQRRPWIGTMNGGLRAWIAGQEVFCNTDNSSLPANHVTAISFSTHGAWIGTLGGGVARIDTTAWTWRVNNTGNSPLPSDRVTAIAHAANGAWVGTEDRGLAKWTPGGAGWTLHNTGNSALPSDRITCIAVDSSQNVWVGTDGGGLAVLRGTTWTTYRATPSGLPSDRILSLLAGPERPAATMWIGTPAGLARFRQPGWRTFTTRNSLLPGDTITALGYAYLGWPLWVGTDRGLVNFRGDTGGAPSPPVARFRP